MGLVDDIRLKFASGRFELSQHALDQSLQRTITLHEMLEVATSADVIEDYPQDKYGPSCLLFGRSSSGRPLHLQVSYPSRPILKVITLYEPDPELWIDFRERKR